jgi:hypothetical protein
MGTWLVVWLILSLGFLIGYVTRVLLERVGEAERADDFTLQDLVAVEKERSRSAQDSVVALQDFNASEGSWDNERRRVAAKAG